MRELELYIYISLHSPYRTNKGKRGYRENQGAGLEGSGVGFDEELYVLSLQKACSILRLFSKVFTVTSTKVFSFFFFLRFFFFFCENIFFYLFFLNFIKMIFY